MTTKQANKLKMYLALRIFLKQNPAITDLLPNFGEFMTALDAAILQIQTNSEILQYNNVGVAGSKIQLRSTLEDTTLDYLRKLNAFAKYGNNVKLTAETNITESKLKTATDFELVDIANGLHTRIETFLNALAAYFLTEATQTSYAVIINNFSDSISISRQFQVDNKECNRLVAEGCIDGDAAISNIDGVVEIVRLSYADFYSSYKATRKIVDSGTTTLQVQGTVLDAATKQPIVDATLIFCLNGFTDVALVKQTANKGGFKVKSLSEGMYNVTISKVGFQPQTRSITVSSTELCEIDVELTKI